MSVDCRTRRHCDRKSLTRDEIFDSLIPEALSNNAELAGRGLQYKRLHRPPRFQRVKAPNKDELEDLLPRAWFS